MAGIRKRKPVSNVDGTITYRGVEISCEVLDAVVDTQKRLLWAFVRNDVGNVMAVPYSEHEVIWMAEKDVLQPEDVEL